MSLHADYEHAWEETSASETHAPALASVPPQAAPEPRPLLYACHECVHGVRMMRSRNFHCRKDGRIVGEQPFVLPPGCPGFVPRTAR
jgi:hypothetical protein